MYKKSLILTLLSFLIVGNTIFSISNASSSSATDPFLLHSFIDSHTTVGQSINKLKDNVLNQQITIYHNQQEFKSTLRDIGFSIDILSTPNDILNTNKASNTIRNFLNQPEVYIVQYRIIPKTEDLEFNLLKAVNIINNTTTENIQFDTATQMYFATNSELNTISNLTEISETLSKNQTQDPIYIQVHKNTNPEQYQKFQQIAEILNAFPETNIKLQVDDKQIPYTINKLDVIVEVDNLTYQFKQSTIDSIYEILKKYEVPRQDLEIQSVNDNKTLNIEGHFQDGKKINTQNLITKLTSLINNNTKDTPLEIDYEIDQAKVINQISNQNFELLSIGKSNFSGSDKGRIHNVKFSSDNKYKAVLLEKDQEFSFNSLLGRVTGVNGWRNAYIIQGGEIVTAPGGGICQMSTTIYRAALNAGLDITQQFNHSLYVSYYTAYGDGLDATIFPGGKDLKFKNNTPADIIIYSYYTDNNDLFVYTFGVNDGREVEMFGPYYNGNNQDNPFNLTTRTNQINWVRTVKIPNQEIKQETLTSTYSKFYKR